MNKRKYTRMYRMNRLIIALLLLGTASCEDNAEPSTPVAPTKEDVQVELSFGFADEDDGYTLSGKTDTRSGKLTGSSAFCAELMPTAQTRGNGDTPTPDLKPDALYKLYVLQYKLDDGTLIKKNDLSKSNPTPAPGTKLSCTLTAGDCRLVVIAFGKDNTVPNIDVAFSEFQKLTMASTIFEEASIPTSNASQNAINKMPYIFYLPHVKVTSDGKLQSPEGAYDARLLLKRLATKLTVNWTLSETLANEGYTLKEVKLSQIPADFRILPAMEDTEEWGTTYPSVVSEFIDKYRLTDEADLKAGKKTVWIPANARGTSAKATSAYYRTKENAPTAASYVELVVDNSQKQERLYYRAYLGGEVPTDFNLYENTDYNWTLNITSTNYRTDGRIQLLDRIPVESKNLVETSNCFMMQPGTNICFNPYKHEAGANGWNTDLADESTMKKTIAKVEVLWQMKDAGTSGDLVLGYAISATNHTNLVNYTDIGDKDGALVHVKVPVTQGGNAVICARDADGVIVWSWHLWISDYIPVGVDASKITSDDTRTAAIAAAKAATQGGTVHTYAGISWVASDGLFYKKVIMDRNLGATKAGVQDNQLDGVRTFGLLYQGGRKDPFFGTADGTANETKTIYDGEGVVFNELKKESLSTLASMIQKPEVYNTGYNSLSLAAKWTGKKTIYDPSPKGWRVPVNGGGYAATESAVAENAKLNMMAGFGTSNYAEAYGYKIPTYNNVMYYDGTQTLKALTTTCSSDFVGSGYIYLGATDDTQGWENSIFFPCAILRGTDGTYRQNAYLHNSVYLWGVPTSTSSTLMRIYQFQAKGTGIGLFSTHTIDWNNGSSIRCVQDN